MIPAAVRPAPQVFETADVLARCLEGDEHAWRVLFDAHAERVWRFAERLGVAPSQLDDVLQEVFIVVFRRLPEFDRSRSSFSTWLLGITLRIAKAHRRRSLRSRIELWLGAAREPVAPESESPDRAYERNAAARELFSALDRMTDKLREVFVLYEIEGVDGADIARLLDVPEGTVRSRLRLARREMERHRSRRRDRGGDA